MRTVVLLSVLKKNEKSGHWELTPVANWPLAAWHAQDFDLEQELGPYYTVRSGALQKLVRCADFEIVSAHRTAVIAVFQERKNLSLKALVTIKEGKEPKMTATADCLVNIKSVSQPTPASVRSELEALGVKGLFPLVNITYAAVSQKRMEAKIPLAFDLKVAEQIATILTSNGALVEVIEQATGATLFTPYRETMKEEEVKAKPKVAEKPAAIDKEYFYVPQILKDVANVVGALVNSPGFTHESVIISGPSGWGKTAFCRPLAEKLGMDLVYVDMSLVLETEELFGQREIKGGDTTFEFNHFVEAVERGNTIVVADEVNRTYAPALNAFLPLLDWRGETVIHGRKIKVGPKTLFIATRNIGSSYVGTQASDAALVSRFGFAAIVDNIPASEEIELLIRRTGVAKGDAIAIVKAANTIREQRELGVNVSPRNTLAIAEMVKVGITPRAAYQWNVVLKEEEQDARIQLESVFNRIFSQDYSVACSENKVEKLF